MMHKKNNTSAIERAKSVLICGMTIGLLSLTMTPAAYSFDFGPFKISVGGDSGQSAKPTGQASATNSQQNTNGPIRSATPSTSPHCRQLSFISKLDVDTAYAHAMRAFSFKTEQEMHAWEANSLSNVRDPSYKHTAHAGSFYRMEQVVKYSGPNGETRAMHMAMTLSKEGASSAIEANYCTNPSEAVEAQASYHDFLNKTIKNIF